MFKSYFSTKKLVLLTALVISIFSCKVKAEDLIINEIMQSNIDTMVDDIHEYPDSWVEIYNPTNERIDLCNYKIGDKKKPEKAYQLPYPYIIYPHSYFVVFCDKEGFNRHSSFRLESNSKGSLYLFHDDEIIDQIDYPAQPGPNIGYGRKTDGSDEWGYMLTPTPEKSNSGGISDIILGSPIFSEPGRVGQNPLTLELSVPEGSPAGTIIRYTLDGSEPVESSVNYSTPLQIESSTVVRARLFCNGAISPVSTTHSYIFHPRAMTTPIISLVTDEKNLYSDKLGILSESMTGPLPNFRYDWRRPVNMEYFESDNNPSELNQLCETRLKGQSSRDNIIKSMVLYANKRFGTKRFNYEFFPESRPGITDFKSIELRNAGTDCYRANMRDGLAQRMMGENADLDWAAWRPAVIYINGKYHGILNIRERTNEDNIYTHFDGLEDVDIVENWRYLSEGTIDAFNEFKAFYEQEGHSLEEYAEYMDVDEFINYFLMEAYFGNFDFPANNMLMWRPIENGKWRWMSKDLDDCLGMFSQTYDFNYIDWIYNPENYPDKNFNILDKEYSTLLFRRLLELPEFQEKLLNKAVVYLGDFLTGKATVEMMNHMWDAFKEEWPDHFKKNTPQWMSTKYWHNEISNFILPRHEIFLDQFAEWFNKGIPVPMIIENNENLVEDIEMQDTRLVTGLFDGKCFAGMGIKINAQPASDNFGGWLMESIVDDKIVSTSKFQGSHFTFSMPEVDIVKVYPVDKSYFDTLSVDYIIDDTEFEYFDINGIKISMPGSTPGIYIRTNGKTYEKIIVR